MARTITAPANTHYPLGMSSAHRWMNCPGSFAATRDRKPDSSPNPAADRGTAIHFVSEYCAKLDLAPSEFPYEAVIVNGEEYEIGEEEREAVALVHRTLLELAGKGGSWQVEQKIEVSAVCGGTADGVAVSAASVAVLDLKTGHKRVEVDENPQLLGYLFGLALKHEKIKVFKAAIVQPTAKPPVSIKSYSRAEVMAFGEKLLAAVDACYKPAAAKFNVGAWCEWCANTACPTRAKEIAKVAAAAFAPKPPSPETMKPEEIVKLLQWKDQILDFLNGVGVYAHEQAEKGMKWDGFKLVQKKSIRRWAEEADAEHALRNVLGDDAYTQKLLSPAQAEKVLKKAGKGADLVEKYAVKPDNGTVLVPVTDPRPAVSAGAAAVFGAANDKQLIG